MKLLLAVLCLSWSAAHAWPLGAEPGPAWLRNLLRHRSHPQRHPQYQLRTKYQSSKTHASGKKVNMDFLVNVIAKGLSKNDADAFDALSAMEKIVQPTLMDSINQMRCEVCWKRDDILAHAKCVKFLTKVCKTWYNGGAKDGKVCPNVCKSLLGLCVDNCNQDGHAKQQQSCDLYTEITGEQPPGAAGDAPAPPATAPGPSAPGNRDGDASSDASDAFPDDASDDKDSDGDGFGDKRDPWPLNPNCYHPGEPCEEDEVAKLTEPETQIIDPTTLNKVGQGLPDQGYDEHSDKLVEYRDRTAHSDDWGNEWPSWNTESHADSIRRICQDYPNSDWCILNTKGRLTRKR